MPRTFPIPENALSEMRSTVILPLLLLVALTAAACGATPALAGVTVRPARTITPGAGARSGTQAMGAPVDSGQPRVLFVGASVTQGWFASSRDRAYPALVAKGLAGGRHVRARTFARPGATAEEAADWKLAVPSDVVVVQIATNDFARDVPVDVFAASYAELLHQVRGASPKADLVCLGAWLDPSSANRLGAMAVDYDVAVRAACGVEGGQYVDLSAAYLDVRNHGPAGRPTDEGPGDLFHPNDRGHAEVASLVLAADGVPEARRPAT
jgi:acyl-CoA thioesterase-1